MIETLIRCQTEGCTRQTREGTLHCCTVCGVRDALSRSDPAYAHSISCDSRHEVRGDWKE